MVIMLIIIGLVLGLAVLVLGGRMIGRRRLDPANLGWMSEQWVAEYRTSHMM